jgi:16S rRNA (cytosine967-C5)-methyltransferase
LRATTSLKRPPRVSPARRAAYEVLQRVESGRGFAADLLQTARVSALREDDRRLATELAQGTLRARGELDYWIERLSGKQLRSFDREVLTILRLGLYQIRFLEKIPPSAAVHEAVELTKLARKRSAAGLVNAVLRNAPRGLLGRSQKADEERRLAAWRSMPEWLRERWIHHYGEQAAGDLALAALAAPPTSLRATAPHADRSEVIRGLEREGVLAREGKYAPCALVVEKGSVVSTALWKEKRVVIQDEASQLVGELVNPPPGNRVLDLCAAPGMKTLQIAAALGEGSLIACDLSARRLRAMAAFLDGFVPVGVALGFARLDAARPLPFTTHFDRILLDAPCSGTGTLARNPEIKWRLGPADITRLAEAQAKMLANALALLAPHGRLVYATCSLEPEENEQVVEQVLASRATFRVLARAELAAERPTLESLLDARGYLHTRPDLHAIDGFFAAVIVAR